MSAETLGLYAERLSLDAALSWIDAAPAIRAVEEASLAQAAGRVLAEPLRFDADRPPQEIALIDGFAVQADSALGASGYNPLYLTLLPEGAAVTAGAAAPCSAGQSLPPGADSVLPLNFAEVLGAMLEVSEAIPRGEGIARRGEAALAGALAMPAGGRLGAAQIALAASAGRMSFQLLRRPNVALWLPGPKPGAAEALAVALTALIARDGGTALLWDADAPPGDADAIFLVGRSGWGADDDAARRLSACGGAIIHHGIALAPGGSTGLGSLGAAPSVLLPGDPYAALVIYEILAGRLVRRLAGRPAPFAGARRRGALTRKIASAVGVAEFFPVRLEGGGAEPLAPSPSDGLATLARADGFVLVPAGLEGFAEGSEVDVVTLDAGGWA
jgi:molybdopterin molybdotransferase